MAHAHQGGGINTVHVNRVARLHEAQVFGYRRQGRPLADGVGRILVIVQVAVLDAGKGDERGERDGQRRFERVHLHADALAFFSGGAAAQAWLEWVAHPIGVAELREQDIDVAGQRGNAGLDRLARLGRRNGAVVQVEDGALARLDQAIRVAVGVREDSDAQLLVELDLGCWRALDDVETLLLQKADDPLILGFLKQQSDFADEFLLQFLDEGNGKVIGMFMRKPDKGVQLAPRQVAHQRAVGGGVVEQTPAIVENGAFHPRVDQQQGLVVGNMKTGMVDESEQVVHGRTNKGRVGVGQMAMKRPR